MRVQNRSFEPTAQSGLTLLELLLVLGILAVVLGSGLGAFAVLEAGPEQARSSVKSVVRRAASAAVERGDGARVRIDRKSGRLWTESFFAVGTWHFEGDLRGAFGLRGEARDASFDPDGWVGSAVLFEGRPNSTVGIPVRQDPGFDPRLGFAVDCAVRREGEAGGRVLDLGGVIAIELGGAGDVRGRFTPANDASEGRSRGGAVTVQSPPGLVPPGRWTRLGLRFDGRRLSLSIEGVVVEVLEVEGTVAALEGPLVLSDPKRPFTGAVDRLVVRVLVRSEEVELPDGVRFAEDGPEEIVFDAGGRLDRMLHQGSVTIPLLDREGDKHPIIVGVHGTVEG